MISFTPRVPLLILVLASSYLYSASAQAADYEMPQHNWTGFHAGVGGGYGMVNNTLNLDIGPDVANLEINGISGEGGFATFEAGYDFQLTERFVLGLQADYGFHGVTTSIAAQDEGVEYTLQQQDSVSVLVRGGRIVDANNMLYNVIGWTHTWYEGALGGGLGSSDYDFALNGFTIGSGIESIIADNLSLKLEYRYSIYQPISIAENFSPDGLPIDLSAADLDATTREQSVRAVLSYRLGAKLAEVDYVKGAWTGFHVGLGGGNGFINRELLADSDLLSEDSQIGLSGLGAEGFLGAIEVGVDYQVGERLVLGLQGDYTMNAIDTEISGTAIGLGSVELALNATNSFSILARAGVLSSPKVLWYGLAGWTHGDFGRTVSASDDAGVTVFEDSTEISANGMTVGVGFEALILDNVSLKTEYRYTNFEAVDAFDLGDELRISALANAQTVRSVLSYRF